MNNLSISTHLLIRRMNKIQRDAQSSAYKNLTQSDINKAWTLIQTHVEELQNGEKPIPEPIQVQIRQAYNLLAKTNEGSRKSYDLEPFETLGVTRYEPFVQDPEEVEEPEPERTEELSAEAELSNLREEIRTKVNDVKTGEITRSRNPSVTQETIDDWKERLDGIQDNLVEPISPANRAKIARCKSLMEWMKPETTEEQARQAATAHVEAGSAEPVTYSNPFDEHWDADESRRVKAKMELERAFDNVPQPAQLPPKAMPVIGQRGEAPQIQIVTAKSQSQIKKMQIELLKIIPQLQEVCDDLLPYAMDNDDKELLEKIMEGVKIIEGFVTLDKNVTTGGLREAKEHCILLQSSFENIDFKGNISNQSLPEAARRLFKQALVHVGNALNSALNLITCLCTARFSSQNQSPDGYGRLPQTADGEPGEFPINEQLDKFRAELGHVSDKLEALKTAHQQEQLGNEGEPSA